MGQISTFVTGVPTPKYQSLEYGTINRVDTTSKVLFRVPRGAIITELNLFTYTASNAGTTGILSLGAKQLPETGTTTSGALLGCYVTNPGVPTTNAYPSGPGSGLVTAVGFSGGSGSGAAAIAVLGANSNLIGVSFGGALSANYAASTGKTGNSYGTGYTSNPTVSLTTSGYSTAPTAAAVACISTCFVNGVSVLSTTGQIALTAVTGLWMPIPYDIEIIGTYAETGTASTAGGPWYVGMTYFRPANYDTFFSAI